MKKIQLSKNTVIQVSIVTLSIYVGICIGAVLMKDRLIYHPYHAKSDISFARQEISTLSEISYKSHDARSLYGFFAKPTHKSKIVVFMHGNSYHLNTFLSRVKPFIQAGYGVMMPEYTGFGGIEGKIRQETLQEDVYAAIRYLNRLGYQNEDIILYGHSLGTYLATNVAAVMGKRNPFSALVLEAPFTSLVDAAAATVHHLLPVGLLLNDGYFLIDKIGQVKTRVFVAHGRQDETIPYEQGVEVFNKAPDPKVFFSSDKANHRTLPDFGFFESVLKWLD